MNSFTMTSLDDVENGVSQIQAIACKIKALGGHADDTTIESAILRALPKSFTAFITSWTLLDSDKRSLENLHAHLMRQVAILRTDEIQTKEKELAATKFNMRKGKQLRSQKQNDEKNTFCNYCKKKGHEIKDCRRLADKRKRETEESTKPTNIESSSKPQQQQQNRPSTSREQEQDSQVKYSSQSGARVAFGLAATINTASAIPEESTSDVLVDRVWSRLWCLLSNDVSSRMDSR